MKEQSRFLLAAPSSGSGKTTVSVGLMDCLVRKGLRVQPFKCGPDYIDTKFHERVCHRASVNLDSFMASESHLKELLESHANGADVCVAEGMMGLFDGYQKSRGSAAEIAAILGLPVILVVDAKSAAYSIAPLLKGFMEFSANVRICGVIFNKVGSERHRKMLEDVCHDVGIEPLGFVPKVKEAENPSRYLGLDFSNMGAQTAASSLIGDNVDIDRLLSITASDTYSNIKRAAIENPRNQKILVARNEESFSFIYAEHLDEWKKNCEVVFFNPEELFTIPPDTDLLYLPGGYPEKHLESLARQKETMESIKRFAEGGGKILAECGGMMYLCRSILSDDGEFPMCGILPYGITARTQDRKMTLGYRQFNYNGLDFKGHEFHYTRFTDPQPESIVQIFDARGEKTSTPVIRIGNTIASYTHLYWGDKDILNIF
ncbi:MAG: cobyrinate a,c-diamide synthase [Bacteroidales bacterium]|jgi:cobyrinic acid a,c-diamide synthase|nr:cobyrinate a,c-diamide synthase [Bacteroidales bacterium]